MALAQLYTFKVSGVDISKAAPAQFILNETADAIIGFVVGVMQDDATPLEEAVVSACLFEPTEVADTCTVVLPTASDEMVRGLLAAALLNNPAMRPEWEKRAGGAPAAETQVDE